MATKSARGRKQDRARVAGGKDYEVRYEAKKTGQSKAKVKSAVKKADPSRKPGGMACTRFRRHRVRSGSGRAHCCTQCT